MGAILLLTIRAVQERVNALATESLSFLKALRQLYPTKTHQNAFFMEIARDKIGLNVVGSPWD